MCWETLSGYRFCSINQLNQLGDDAANYPSQFTVFRDYEYTLANQGKDLESKMYQIIEYEFPQLANNDEKRKVGANNHVHIIFDLDKLEYVELKSEPDENEDPEVKERNKNPTRYIVSHKTNELHNKEGKEGCEKEEEDRVDKSRLVPSQSLKTQNTFADQLGRFTIPPRFEMRAGDAIDVMIYKTLIGGGQGAEGDGYDKKHSGLYIIRQVGHHIFADGKAYTKIQTLRPQSVQDDEGTSEPSLPQNQPIPSPIRRPLPNSPTSVFRGNRILFPT